MNLNPISILGDWLLALQRRSPAYKKTVAEMRRIEALPLEVVKQRALEMISDPLRFRSTTRPLSPNPLIDTLGPVLRDFFERFESVEEIYGDFKASRRTVSASAIRPGFITIGTDFEHSELVAHAGDDRVYIVTDPKHALGDGMPTIYHDICLQEIS
jgi:hypothetical protein